MVIEDYNNTYHRTIRMTPHQARGYHPDPGATEAEREQWMKRVHKRVRDNLAQAGQRALYRAQKEARGKLPPVSVNDIVLVAASVKRKKHGVARGYAVNCCPFSFSTENLTRVSRWVAVARVVSVTSTNGYKLLYLSNSSEGYRDAGERPATTYRREQLKLLPEGSDITEFASFFNRLSSAQAEKQGSSPGPVRGDKYVVECLLGWMKSKRGGPRFLVKWKGYKYSDSTWVSAYVSARYTPPEFCIIIDFNIIDVKFRTPRAATGLPKSGPNRRGRLKNGRRG